MFHILVLLVILAPYGVPQILPDPTANVTGTCDEPNCYRPAGFPQKLHFYNWTVSRVTLPGTTKPSIVINGQLPGPTIEVNESDTIIVHLYNQLDNDTAVTIHWHGLFQYSTSYNDGIPNVSQCVQYPQTGNYFVYAFTAEPAGTTWYHGHFDNQYIDGLFGPLIIHRRGGDLYRKEYSQEMTWIMNDWYDYPARDLRLLWYLTPQNVDGVEPEPDAIMVNGKFTPNLAFNQIDPTNRALVRVINAAGFSMYNVSVDSLLLNIVSIDGVDLSPPLVVPWVIVNVAQRVDFILDFPTYPVSDVNSIHFHVDAVLDMYPVTILNYTQPSPPYPPNTQCRFDPNFIGTINFATPTANPISPPPSPTPRKCPNADFNLLDASPFDYIPLPAADYTINLTISFNTYTDIQLGYLNNITFPMNTIGNQYGMPELYAFVLQSLNGTAAKIGINASGPGPVLHSDSSLRFYIPDKSVVDIFVRNTDDGGHPFHLHGHQFPIIATSDCPQAEQYFAGNYLRRDTVTVPGGNDTDLGWAWIRLQAINPGVWMFHCHIDWHIEAGLGCLFMESPNQVYVNAPPLEQRQFCNAIPQNQTSDHKKLTRLELGLTIGIAILFVLFIASICVHCLRGNTLRQTDRHVEMK